ncbi:MAG: carboxymuconolactone decarboxylase family protein [Pseudomonadota bacterium]|nr:carboxymuconolactone decarboxylase family protein [Pseudomonadota bacterium]
MMDWNRYREQIMATAGQLAEQQPEVMKGFAALDEGASKTKHLDAKTRELIALAVAVTTRCDGCIAVHSKAAVDSGATKQEIAEALGVAMALNAGAALVYSARAMDAASNQSA